MADPNLVFSAATFFNPSLLTLKQTLLCFYQLPIQLSSFFCITGLNIAVSFFKNCMRQQLACVVVSSLKNSRKRRSFSYLTKTFFSSICLTMDRKILYLRCVRGGCLFVLISPIFFQPKFKLIYLFERELKIPKSTNQPTSKSTK